MQRRGRSSSHSGTGGVRGAGRVLRTVCSVRCVICTLPSVPSAAHDGRRFRLGVSTAQCAECTARIADWRAPRGAHVGSGLPSRLHHPIPGGRS
eukprot:365109-Chlamydomonas_euryale.AAC.5